MKKIVLIAATIGIGVFSYLNFGKISKLEKKSLFGLLSINTALAETETTTGQGEQVQTQCQKSDIYYKTQYEWYITGSDWPYTITTDTYTEPTYPVIKLGETVTFLYEIKIPINYTVMGFTYSCGGTSYQTCYNIPCTAQAPTGN